MIGRQRRAVDAVGAAMTVVGAFDAFGSVAILAAGATRPARVVYAFSVHAVLGAGAIHGVGAFGVRARRAAIGDEQNGGEQKNDSVTTKSVHFVLLLKCCHLSILGRLDGRVNRVYFDY
jgi:hypothetical protein